MLFRSLGVLDEIAQGKHLYEFPLLYLEGGRVGMNRRWPLILDCMRFLLTRPWWYRVWTLQEVRIGPLFYFDCTLKLADLTSLADMSNRRCCPMSTPWFILAPFP